MQYTELGFFWVRPNFQPSPKWREEADINNKTRHWIQACIISLYLMFPLLWASLRERVGYNLPRGISTAWHICMYLCVMCSGRMSSNCWFFLRYIGFLIFYFTILTAAVMKLHKVKPAWILQIVSQSRKHWTITSHIYLWWKQYNL